MTQGPSWAEDSSESVFTVASSKVEIALGFVVVVCFFYPSCQAISKNHISRCCMMMRCVEIQGGIDGITSCTAVQPYSTAVEVIRLHSSQEHFVF